MSVNRRPARLMSKAGSRTTAAPFAPSTYTGAQSLISHDFEPRYKRDPQDVGRGCDARDDVRESANHGSPESCNPRFQTAVETSEEEHMRLCTEKTKRIEVLKTAVRMVDMKEEQLQAETKEGEEKIAWMKAELERLQPKQERETPQEFFLKEAKVKKGKKKQG